MFAAVGRQKGVWRRAGEKACGRLCDLRGDSFLFLIKSFGGDVRLCDGIAHSLPGLQTPSPFKEDPLLGHQGADCRVFHVPPASLPLACLGLVFTPS